MYKDIRKDIMLSIAHGCIWVRSALRLNILMILINYKKFDNDVSLSNFGGYFTELLVS